jgi:hypothetical protein
LVLSGLQDVLNLKVTFNLDVVKLLDI